MKFKKVQKYIQELGDKKHAGFSDWRLPTLEEAMSLMGLTKNEHGLHIHPIFDKKQEWIWTADKRGSSEAWFVFFYSGSCNNVGIDNFNIYVRAVR